MTPGSARQTPKPSTGILCPLLSVIVFCSIFPSNVPEKGEIQTKTERPQFNDNKRGFQIDTNVATLDMTNNTTLLEKSNYNRINLLEISQSRLLFICLISDETDDGRFNLYNLPWTLDASGHTEAKVQEAELALYPIENLMI